MGKWKGIRMNIHLNPEEPLLLYNLDEDPREVQNFAGQHPEIMEKIEQIMESAHRDSEFFRTDH
jgi:arylsulfatase